MIKRIGLMLTFIMGTLFLVNAQDSTKVRHHRSPEERAAKRTAALTKHLKLSADQSKQVGTILLSQAKEITALKTDQSALSKADKRKKFKAASLASDAKINAVLNDGQKQEYTALKEKMKSKMKNRHKKERAS